MDLDGLGAFVACRRVPLNKDPGVQPIGICEIVRQIVGKQSFLATKQHVLNAVGHFNYVPGKTRPAASQQRTLYTRCFKILTLTL